MNDLAVAFLCYSYNLIILGSTVYLIGWKNWNPWWILVAMLFLTSVRIKT